VFADAVDAFDPAVSVLMVGNAEVFDRRVDGEVLAVGSEALARHLTERLDRARAVLGADGRPLVLLTVPCADPVAPKDPRAAAVRADPARVAWVNDVLRSYADAHPDTVHLADVGTVLCPGGNPHPVLGTAELRPNGVNLSAAGAAAVWRWLAPIARELVTTEDGTP
jgi:hypothetical protein